MKTRVKIGTVVVACLVGLAASACDKESNAEASEAPAAKAQAVKSASAGSEDTPAKAAEAPKKVAVAKDGTKFDPPVEKAQIPEGAWICDMGTVHYARMDKGDGKCPTCGMNLVQHGSAKHDAHDHHDGHDHSEH